ncbi:sel1 repeat family protein [Dysgonomonas sp. 216]|uniref:SEL1-like repeat protein n=1 Tax=Dysgonomonas sp. 216 TaxID=2302934 RepID=UPI0013D785E0|nr:SEL1-like repeat protein [Dysgonomonas sp. 216]NDW17870.1 sel1 repeat family protein [Dysgonomonas sp. 216]
MFNFFKKKGKDVADSGSNNGGNSNRALKQAYDELLNKYRDNPSLIKKQAEEYNSKDNYADPMVWMDAMAICDVSLEKKAVTETVKELYNQIYSRAWNKHVSVDFSDEDYDFWFKLNVSVNNRFIEMGHLRGYCEQADLYGSARRPYRDYAKMRECFKKGIEVNDAASLGDYGYGLYFGVPGYGEQDKDKGLEYMKRSKELGYELADLLFLHIEFYDNKDDESLLKYIENYIEKASPTRKCYYILSDYYSRKGEYDKSIEPLKKGVAINEHYSQYLYGMGILRGNIEGNKEEAKELLADAFSYNINYAAEFLGQYNYYSGDEGTSVEKAIEWHKKAVQYYSHNSLYELAIIYLYNDTIKDVAKGNKYLDQAVEEDSPRAMSEKAYLLLEDENPSEQKVKEAIGLLEKAMELGNDYAPYRLAQEYERGVLRPENPDYAKILELYELAAERGHVGGMDMAGHYYRLDVVNEDEENGAKAVKYFEWAVARNSNYSRVELALCYEYGTGVEQDYQKAFDLYKAAADNGYIFANLKMGYYLEDALLGEEDLAGAFEQFKIAAEAGMPEAIYNVGRFYKYAVGIPENPELAMQNFNKAAEEGYPQALVEVGLAYEQEYAGIEFDAQKAMEYMTRAAEADYAFAQYKVGYYYHYGLVETDLPKALEWYERAHEQGYPYAAIMLGEYYVYNHGGEKDYDRAFEYYQSAAERDIISEGLGVCYEYGLGVEENNTEAFKYYTIAAERDYRNAKYRLGLCYKYGTGTTENMEEAYRWLSEAAEDDHFSSKYEVAMMLLEGKGTAKDEPKAVELLTVIAEDDHDDAQFELGNCYLTGKGVAEDETQAMYWYQRAAENGNEQAQKITGKRERRRR